MIDYQMLTSCGKDEFFCLRWTKKFSCF